MDRLVRRTGLPLACAVAVAGISLWGWQAWRVRQAASALGPAPPSANVLLIVLDTVRAKSLSLHGYPHRTTPALEAFAKTGVRFDRALATAPWTGPTHASLFTGQYPGSLSIGWREPLDGTYVTLAEALRGRGYETRAFVANTFGCTFERGLDRGFIEYRDYPVSAGEVLRSSSLVRGLLSFYRVRRALDYYENLGRQDAPGVTADFLAWLDRSPGRPFFAFLNYFDAHDPYHPPVPFDTLFGPNPRGNPWMIKRWWDRTSYTGADIDAERKAYEGAIAYLDREIGRLLDELRRRGTLDRTLVVITSDHGEEFGEHGRVGHGHSLFMELLHVPLVIVFPPAVPAGAAVTQPVTLRDLPATIEDLLGAPATGFAGASLARYWRGAAGEPVMAQQDRSHSVVSGRYHYIRNPRAERVFDIVADPDEQHDLVAAGQAADLLPGLRQALDAAVAADRAAGPRAATGARR
jgi:arylsulfatase A-like enzyme